ncbi:response regulator [Phenylobacterium sp.]|uniref:response regulator n=1 Tax=Phenylobacterium sp. TaxID=1871053 RepID=UPI0019B463D3|nr:response regulator [Phenylobacterium sp.]MBC7169221.1 response regulator [Phenylobacterium sp.]
MVDDDVTLLQAIAQILGAESFEVVLADQPNLATQFLNNLNVDLAIVDIFMPERDGVELIRDIKARRPDLPIIAMSGGWRSINPDTVLEMARALGAEAGLIKPFDRATLTATVAEVLGRRP